MNISCRIANADTQCGQITNPPERVTVYSSGRPLRFCHFAYIKPKSGKAQKKSTSQQVNKSTNALLGDCDKLDNWTIGQMPFSE